MSDCSSDVCSSDLRDPFAGRISAGRQPRRARGAVGGHDPQDRGKGGSMSFRIRAARDEDLQPLYEMAKLTGGGFTNLPPDKHALEAKLDRSRTSLDRKSTRLNSSH